MDDLFHAFDDLFEGMRKAYETWYNQKTKQEVQETKEVCESQKEAGQCRQDSQMQGASEEDTTPKDTGSYTDGGICNKQNESYLTNIGRKATAAMVLKMADPCFTSALLQSLNDGVPATEVYDKAFKTLYETYYAEYERLMREYSIHS